MKLVLIAVAGGTNQEVVRFPCFESQAAKTVFES